MAMAGTMNQKPSQLRFDFSVPTPKARPQAARPIGASDADAVMGPSR
jgi:hypothetical protein